MTRSEWGVLGCLVASCALGCGGGDGDAEDAPPPITFTKDIHPILVAKCGTSGCHDMANLFMPGHGSRDVNVAYEQATGVGSLGMPIYDRIIARVSSADPGSVMPPPYAVPPCEGAIGKPGCVTQDELDLIKEWVADGHLK